MNLEVQIIKVPTVLKIFKNEVPTEGLAGIAGELVFCMFDSTQYLNCVLAAQGCYIYRPR